MRVDMEKARRPGRKLRKLLKRFPANPAPEHVHMLRTQTRKVEATLDALLPEGNREAKRLTKALKPMRKAAGRVRDMDVLLRKALALGMKPEQKSVATLIEHMDRLRKEYLRALARSIRRHGKKSRKLLKRYLRMLKETSESAATAECAVRLGEAAAELNHWPQLEVANLHAFRIRAKEISYMLQLMEDADGNALETFARVKDTAGDWHDWVELQRLAQSVLDAERDAAVLAKIHQAARKKLHAALMAANAARKHGREKLAA